jgi:hypothetical protein
MGVYRKGLWRARIRCRDVWYLPQVFVPYREMVDENRPDLGVQVVPGRFLLHQTSELHGWVQWCVKLSLPVWPTICWQEQA